MHYIWRKFNHMRKLYTLLFILSFVSGITAQEIIFPDPNFLYKLTHATTSNQTAKDLGGNWSVVDANYDGIITQDEADNISQLFLSTQPCCTYITSLVGIQSFHNLNTLDISNNFYLTELDLTGLVHMWSVDCRNNQITSLTLTGLTGMQNLSCNSNQLTTLDLSGLTTLSAVWCSDNQLTSINLQGATAMDGIACSNNQLTSLDFSGCPLMRSLEADNNLLTTLDFSNCPIFVALQANNNLLTSINLSNNPLLYGISVNNNLLTTLDLTSSNSLSNIEAKNNQLVSFDAMKQVNGGMLALDNNPALQAVLLKNGRINNNGFTFSNCPNLVYLCIDENEQTVINTKLAQYGYTNNVNVNSYCSFVPGGTFYTIQGDNKVDLNNNGCDAADLSIPNLKFNIAGPSTGTIISDSNGHYSIPVQSGWHTVTPVFENPAYFNISPTSAQISLPGSGSTFTQNFCVSITNPVSDLEITLLPLEQARPGFNSYYKLVVKNKGNTLQNNVTASFNFNDGLVDFVSAQPIATTQTTGNLTWNLNDLHPLETQSIFITMNVNSPMETPAVNSGDVLPYSASVSGTAADVMPSDNTSSINQVVVNSLDPNDKTCLEGTVATPDIAGKYVHYIIRFENTGTFAAENIVVMDMINTAQFDLASLVPTTSSHPFATRISGNKVEFIFENINLPFDDANNNGFVAFKIKTKPTLTVGDSFTNSAAIYFDYNFPIITNDATTVIQLLGTSDFTFNDYFSVYPNPADATLSVRNAKNIQLNSVSIYNSLGQLLLAVPNANTSESIDVSGLQTGNYFLKLYTEKGISTTKFIKK